MSVIKVDIAKQVKPMKPMHGGGQPPIGGKGLTEYFHYLTEAGIPYSPIARRWRAVRFGTLCRYSQLVSKL